MKFYAINGSPRKNYNTAKLLQKTLEGAQSENPDIETEIINLYDLQFTGCTSCFACKRLDGVNYGKCGTQDELTPILEKLATSDAIILGSPIYFGNITGEMKSFLERFIFPYLTYDANYTSLAPKKMLTAFIYTMNIKKEIAEEWDYPLILAMNEKYLTNIFTKPETQWVYNTYQFNDYSKYKAEAFSLEDKKEQRKNIFPIDLENAYNLGIKLAKKLI